jgi:HEAT repeat protein
MFPRSGKRCRTSHHPFEGSITMRRGKSAIAEEVSDLIAQLKDQDPVVRVQAAVQLHRLESKAAPAVPTLLATLSDSDPIVRYEVVRALRVTVSSAEDAIAAIAPLVDTLKDESANIRSTAIFAIDFIRMKSGADPLNVQAVSALKALGENDPSEEVR